MIGIHTAEQMVFIFYSVYTLDSYPLNLSDQAL